SPKCWRLQSAAERPRFRLRCLRFPAATARRTWSSKQRRGGCTFGGLSEGHPRQRSPPGLGLGGGAGAGCAGGLLHLLRGRGGAGDLGRWAVKVYVVVVSRRMHPYGSPDWEEVAGVGLTPEEAEAIGKAAIGKAALS